MASTARSDADKAELFDSAADFEKKVELLAQWIRDSKRCIAFTVSKQKETERHVKRDSHTRFSLISSPHPPPPSGCWYQHVSWQ